MGASDEMHTERKSRCFIMTVAHLLRYGFALTAKNAAELTDAKLLPLLDSLSPTRTGIAKGEQHCYDLLNANVVDCFALNDDNDDVEKVKATVPRFALTLFGCEVSPITLHVYVEHLVTRLHCSEEAIMMSVVYIARAVKKGIPFTPRSAHRMIAAALVVALKTHDERQYPMYYYAKVTGIPHAKLVKAEAAMLQILDFATFVSPAEYVLMLFSLRSCHAQTSEPEMFQDWGKVMQRLSIPTSIRAGKSDNDGHERTLRPASGCGGSKSRHAGGSGFFGCCELQRSRRPSSDVNVSTDESTAALSSSFSSAQAW